MFYLCHEVDKEIKCVPCDRKRKPSRPAVTNMSLLIFCFEDQWSNGNSKTNKTIFEKQHEALTSFPHMLYSATWIMSKSRCFSCLLSNTERQNPCTSTFTALPKSHRWSTLSARGRRSKQAAHTKVNHEMQCRLKFHRASVKKIKELAIVPHLFEIARPDDTSVSPRRFSFRMEVFDLNNLN